LFQKTFKVIQLKVYIKLSP